MPLVQAWAEKHGLGRLEVTNLKDYDLIRFHDDRAIQMVPNEGKSVRYHCLRTVQVEVAVTALPVGGWPVAVAVLTRLVGSVAFTT